ncbi:CIA30 family protein [Pseudoalteromonas sp. SG45-5]|uniref:CIA30 family protein n=1 Tax=unclassified Pseudoalteromonas TaxID=194690 RepID=UPI0015FD9311|nr:MULTISPECIES: CIA30 family protein [unclassified Pseudoalteromonas]MBB1384720.1 CIA30 family protein [Pseudoalteromonas sp. SG45-5]MBB1392711.1 CIA30 family protein [Pseudoalteromonas sp. SG44-4]MBB1446414.1 CIA30 family protein [Pseudoalteromonas sp. SG41-6]
MTTKQLSSLFIFNALLLSTEANAVQRWYVVNDSVMGGISNSQVVQTQGSLVFTGNVSLDNNGGFASIRTELNTQSQNTKGIMLRVKGDGQTYQLRLRTTDYLDGAAYTHSFKTVKNEWLNINFIPSDFTLSFRGRVLDQQPTIDFNDIRQLGFMIAGKQEGKFKLEVSKIQFKS